MARFIYYPPASIFVAVISAATFLLLAVLGLAEVRGQHLQYSKFGCKNDKKGRAPLTVSSRVGMFLLYFPAFLAGVVWLALFAGDASPRFLLLACAVSVHFLKRVLEVLFVHKYSGAMGIESTVMISSSYFLFSVISIYSQYLAGVSEPSVDLKYAGVILFFIGILGNLYHHILLSKLRTKDGEGYKIPRGGLFGLVICPHYLFEIMGFIGMSMISPTVFTISFTLGSTLYLMGRSYTTRNWYLTRFPDFPKQVKAIIPNIF